MYIAKRVLNDLYCRFLSNVPQEEREDPVRMMFHVQEAHWFYLDYIAPLEHVSPGQRSTTELSLRGFTFKISSYLGWPKHRVNEYVKNFWKYCAKIPRCGGILVNPRKTKVLLVRGWGGKRWNFPMGKINHEEEYKTCAQREVFEETGFQGHASDDMVQYKRKQSLHRLFMFYDIPEDYDFQPQTRKEIEEIKWVELRDLTKFVRIKPIERQLWSYLKPAFPPVGMLTPSVKQQLKQHVPCGQSLVDTDPKPEQGADTNSTPPETESSESSLTSSSVESSPETHGSAPANDLHDIFRWYELEPFDPLPPPRQIIDLRQTWTNRTLSCT